MFNNKLCVLLLILSSIFLTTCKKPSFKADTITVPGAPTIGTATSGNALALVTFTAPVSNGGSPITGYSVTSSPGGFTGTGSGSPVTVTGLTNGTTYTFTVTASNAKGTSLASSASNSVTPSTVPGAPTIGTATAGNAQATVTFTAPASNGGSAITGYTVTSGPGGITATGSASPVTITGLINGTAYTFTVTATNVNGTGTASSTSNSVTPSTVPGAPTIGTAIAGDAKVTITFTPPASNGGSPITRYTVTSSPGAFTGTASSSPVTVTGLTNGTAYTFTVTATNANGTSTASSSSNSVTPIPALINDVDGNVYNTVTIGTQIWLKENLKTTKYNDGVGIPLVTDTTAWSNLSSPGYCWYNNDATTYKATYGTLYNWYAVNTGKLCPSGWHVPSDTEWTTLENYLIANGYNYDGTTIGNKIAKALALSTLWNSSTYAGSVGNTDYPAKQNSSGFTALPGGCRGVYADFRNIGYKAYWWSSTISDFDSSHAWMRGILNEWDYVERTFYWSVDGFSVRCLKD